MAEKIPIASAKTPKDLKTTYDKVKSASKDYGFTSVTNLKEDVVSKAMTDKKKAADFVVELEIKGKVAIVQLVCDVKGAMRSVIGRKEIKTVEDYENASALAKLQAFKKFKEELHGK
jgi:hypothetical protein